MSQTYNLICHDCRVALWIGQGTLRPYIYGTDVHRAVQSAFLLGHIGHRLEVNEDQQTDIDYTALDDEGQPFEDDVSSG
jgi:hypothetical protein